jgi:hypothetical protein
MNERASSSDQRLRMPGLYRTSRTPAQLATEEPDGFARLLAPCNPIARPREAPHTRDVDQAKAQQHLDPIIIYRSVGRDGQTFALHPLSMDRLRDHFGDQVEVHQRIFIAHESVTRYEHLRENLAAQIVALLTGVSIKRLEELGGVSFRDPVDNAEISLRRTGDAPRAIGDLG